jgi:antitoxin component YwqK of YwqJK toxin-antitoxin module
MNGHKSSMGEYDNGVKVGKWLIWNDNGLTEVHYDNNKIASIKTKSYKGLAHTN